ncbi:hypothetical protein HQO26_05325 [Rhodococcus fascians]|nr:hypothetical protein [Rhodococcus fascians]MBY4416279.1 hypothetical protein [Rhodococcus fascians]
MTTIDTTKWRSWSIENPVVLASALSIFIAGLRIIQVSRADPEVLRTLIQTLDVTTIVLATMLPLMPTLALIAMMEAFDWHRQKPKELRPKLPPWFTMIPIVLLGVLVYVPWLLLLSYTATYLGFEIWRRRKKSKGLDSNYRITFVGTAVALIAFTLFNGGTMWLPHENVKIDGQPEQSAYVLSSDVRWTTLLMDKGTVRIAPTATVTNRQPCHAKFVILESTFSNINLSDKMLLPDCITSAASSTDQPKETKMTSGAPWWAFIATAIVSLIATVVSIFSVWYTARKSSRRELDNWIRQTLLIEIHRFHEKTNQIKSLITKDETGNAIEILEDMTNDISTLLIAGSKELNHLYLQTLRKITRILANSQIDGDAKSTKISLLQLGVSNQLRTDFGIEGAIDHKELERDA